MAFFGTADILGTVWTGEPAVISIVDDDAWARSGLADLILSLGYEVRSFESAEQFIQSGGITETNVPDHGPEYAGLEWPRSAKPSAQPRSLHAGDFRDRVSD